MAFEYNGFIHRDLEPQVRYDAEQVQLLKQADVTINENLQTINENLQTVNTELNGKLTKPTNPSAESAVTMLADGTVGTKPLSEIGGGGGGKLYRHKINFGNRSGDLGIGSISFEIIDGTGTAYTKNTLNNVYSAEFHGIKQHNNTNDDEHLAGVIWITNGFIEFVGYYTIWGAPGIFDFSNSGVPLFETQNFTDTFTEL